MPDQPPVKNGKVLPTYHVVEGRKIPILYDDEWNPVQPPIIPSNGQIVADPSDPIMQEFMRALERLQQDANNSNAQPPLNDERLLMQQQLQIAADEAAVDNSWGGVSWIGERRVGSHGWVQGGWLSVFGLCIGVLAGCFCFRFVVRYLCSSGQKTSEDHHPQEYQHPYNNTNHHMALQYRGSNRFSSPNDKDDSTLEKLRERVLGSKAGLAKKLDSVC
eukprot:CAMPEP_0113862080 /NCGR_PEP_ID=MMETSP0372-20130328/15003_1 /TAXON_ID=340204 /ORGANISM="Lankesteria abbotti" /LENGTH=217 /DNA_ID=CAMNT_0000842973 /DNA_START=122 /DNA_END=775 /DNA_ORIENTATION=+ /assembly_acc=CAM_ASM_000359